jgi:hypothetical protein
MQCRDIESVLENEGLSALPEAVRAHAASCSACSSLIADFSAIVSVAETLPAEVEPPIRVWVALRNQLEAEGLIKTNSATADAPPASWPDSLARILRGRALATAAVGLIIVAAAVVQIRVNKQPVNRGAVPESTSAAEVPASPISLTEPLGATGQTLHQEEQNLPMVQQADFGDKARVEDRADVSLRQNLKSINQFIEECRRRLKEDPNDELAREYLSAAYQQKAELLSAMLDRGRSVN